MLKYLSHGVKILHNHKLKKNTTN